MASMPTEDVWNSLKELKTIVWKYLNQPPESDLPTADFENILRKHKQNFFNLLLNPPKNAKKREELKAGMVQGIHVKGIGSPELSTELYQEIVVLSDMFDINELVALDLLCTAQIQMPYYPGFPRGLVAILLYYDGRKALLSTLLCLVQARHGIQWCINIKPELSRFVTDYTDQLLDGGLLTRILELLVSLDLSSELEKLQSNLALGGPKHRRQVTDLFNDIRTILAEIMFSWSIQCGLPKECTIALLNHLKELNIEYDASGGIDDVTLYLQMALLSAIDLSVFHTREDGEEVVQSLPILADSTFISDVVVELLPPNTEWVCEGLRALTTFGMAVCLASLKVLSQNYMYQDAINKEDVLMDAAIEMNVFTFLHNIILENKTLYKEHFLFKRMHNLLTDFVVYMYPKVKDLRMKANEVSRTLQVYIREGLEAPSSLPRYFEFLLLSIGKFYKNNIWDDDYTLNWWSPIEINPDSSLDIRIPPRSVALFKLIKLSGDILPSTLFVPFIKMLSGLSGTGETARYCFNLLKQSGVHLSHTLTWDHFFLSFGQYFNNLRLEAPPQADTVYRLRPGYHKGVSPQELEGLHAVLLLIRTVSEQDSFVRLAICEHPAWSPLNILLGLVSCSVPLPFKADLLLTLASLVKSGTNANQMWNNLEASQILVTIPTTSSYVPRGVETELDEIESRLEEYPLTRAMLRLIDNLTNFEIPRTLGAGPRRPGFDPYLAFIINSVFLKFNVRSYRNNEEKWDVAYLCLKLFEKFLNHYEPKVADFPNQKDLLQFNSPPGYHLMIQFNNNTEALNLMLDIMDEANRYFESFVSFSGLQNVQDCTFCCLNIILRTLILYDTFLDKLTKSCSNSLILTSMSKLLLAINRRSGKPDHCINITKYVCYQQYLPRHALVAVKILRHITSTLISHNVFMDILTTTVEQDQIKSGFLHCLESQPDNAIVGNNTKKEILELLKQCLGYNAPNLTHYLMGFDIKRDVSQTEFQYPGIMGFPRSCVHSLFSILESAVSKTVQPQHVSVLESSYHLMYLLASNPKTSDPFLRFIRLNKHFFISHLKECHKDMSKSHRHLRNVSWLMKTLAIELKVACNSKQVTYLKQFTTFLGNIPPGEEGQDTMFLYKVFSIELKDLQGVPELFSPQTGIEVTDPKILKKHADACEALVEFVNGWRQVVEVVVTFLPLEILDSREQQVFSITLLLSLVKKVVRSNVLPEVSRLLSGAVLLIMNNIKSHYLKEKRGFNVLNYYLGSLKDILESLIRWVLTSDVIDGELRINLYASLVTFLQMTSVDSSEDQQDKIDSEAYVPSLDGPRAIINPKDRQIRLSTDIIDNFGEKLMEVLCKDCIGGQEICKILAMSSFGHLMAFTTNSSWAVFISGHGFLKHIIQSILRSDSELKAMLEPGFENAKSLYLYLSKMVLLTRLSNSKIGAQLLLENNVFGVLSKMTVYNLHPEIASALKNDILENFLPAPEQRYFQMFMPTLDLCNSILTTLGTENQSAITQIMYFLFNHADVIELILRSGDTDLSVISLKELAVLTSVISRAASNNMINILENPSIVVSNRGQLYRIQKLMLNLLSKFLLTEENVKKLLANPKEENTCFPTSDRLLYAMQIASNILWYARNIIANNDIEHGEVGVLFYPSLYDQQGNVLPKKILGHSTDQEPSLGLVIQQLIFTVNYLQQRKVTFDLLDRKMHEVPDMNSMDLRDFVEDHMEMADLAVKRERTFEVISEKLVKKKKELEYCSFIIENSLYLIWAHLDYFMLRSTPNPRSTVYIQPSSISCLDVAVPASSDAVWKVSSDVIVSLKQGLIALFNDSFSKQVLEASQDRTEADTGFTEALLRKSKRLIQFVRAL